MAELYPHEHCTPLTYNGTDAAPTNVDMLGDIWVDIDNTLGIRKYAFVSNTGATAAAIANGNCVVYTDSYGLVVSTHVADSVRGCLRGVGQGAIAIGSKGWIQTDGYHAAVTVDNSTFALGSKIVMSATDLQGTLCAIGTAPPYPEVGTSLGASTGSGPYSVAAQLHVGKFTIAN